MQKRHRDRPTDRQTKCKSNIHWWHRRQEDNQLVSQACNGQVGRQIDELKNEWTTKSS